MGKLNFYSKAKPTNFIFFIMQTMTTTNNQTQTSSLGATFWASFPTELYTSLQNLPPQEQALAQMDLAFVASLLTAVNSLEWKFKQHGQQLNSQQALNTATTHMFLKGSFSSEEFKQKQLDEPGLAKANLKADSLGLFNLTQIELQEAFQVNLFNPLAGMAQRIAFIHALADTLHQNENHFGPSLAKRPSDLIQHHNLFQKPSVKLQTSQISQLLESLMAKNFSPEFQLALTLAHLLEQPLKKLGFQVENNLPEPKLWYIA